MRKLLTILSAAACLAAFCLDGFTQDSVDQTLKLETNDNSLQSPATEETGNGVPSSEAVDPAEDLYRSLIFSVRTTNGFTIYGIPMEPEVLPIHIFGAEAKIPWSSIRRVRFEEDGGATVDLDDGSILKGFTSLQQLSIDKDWGSIRVFRDTLKSITRETGRKSSKQSTFRTPGVPYQVNPRRPTQRRP